MRDTPDYDAVLKGIGQASFAQGVHDVRALITFFNSQYELYGRHVVLKTFDGKGNWTQEASYQDQAGASTDAQTTYDMGGFASELAGSLGSYADALSAHHVITLTLDSLSGFRSNAPYLYGVSSFALPGNTGESFAAVTCQEMAHLPAIYAGDVTYQHMTRKFAVIEPDQPAYAGAADTYIQQARGCGIPVEKLQYNVDLAGEASQAAQIIAKLKADGVTTVMFSGDPIMPIYLTQAASSAQYQPEWLFNNLPNSIARQGDAGEMAHAMIMGPWRPATQSVDRRMCHRIYMLADPHGSPQSGPAIDLYCSGLLAFFGALQSTGPTLTASAFQHGWFAMPPSLGGGDFGTWNFSGNQWTPGATFNLAWWNGKSRSPADGGTGQSLPCNAGAEYLYASPTMASGQPKCFA